jgi:hypothetical protein
LKLDEVEGLADKEVISDDIREDWWYQSCAAGSPDVGRDTAANKHQLLKDTMHWQELAKCIRQHPKKGQRAEEVKLKKDEVAENKKTRQEL